MGGRPWPRNADDFVDFLESRAEEPCGRTCIDAEVATLNYFEKAGEVPESDYITTLPEVRNAVRDLNVQLAQGEGRLRKKAPLVLKKIMVAWELMVMSEVSAKYIRGLAWYRLVSVWASMRFDDSRGLLSETMELNALGLLASLGRTKTSGAGKRVETMEVVVSTQAYLAEPLWLVTGFGLWRQMGLSWD